MVWAWGAPALTGIQAARDGVSHREKGIQWGRMRAGVMAGNCRIDAAVI